MKLKIYGAGSIGNHLTQASRRMGWEVHVVDPSDTALHRMKHDIYPTRYGAWDDSIVLHRLGSEPSGGFDGIILGTPPDVRMALARRMLKEGPRFMLLEKPLCGPSCTGLSEFMIELAATPTKAFVGYDHAVSPAVTFMRELLPQIGRFVSIDCEFRDEWGPIFAAHPWLSGPKDSYLGFRERGGGASGEHSHALHLCYTLMRDVGWGEDIRVSTSVVMSDDGDYDLHSTFLMCSEKGVVARTTQDVVTKPTNKRARVDGTNGHVEWRGAFGAMSGDEVHWRIGEKTQVKTFPKKRPDDFFAEVTHISDVLSGKVAYNDSPIRVESGAVVMALLAVAAKKKEGVIHLE